MRPPPLLRKGDVPPTTEREEHRRHSRYMHAHFQALTGQRRLYIQLYMWGNTTHWRPGGFISFTRLTWTCSLRITSWVNSRQRLERKKKKEKKKRNVCRTTWHCTVQYRLYVVNCTVHSGLTASNMEDSEHTELYSVSRWNSRHAHTLNCTVLHVETVGTHTQWTVQCFTLEQKAHTHWTVQCSMLERLAHTTWTSPCWKLQFTVQSFMLEQ